MSCVSWCLIVLSIEVMIKSEHINILQPNAIKGEKRKMRKLFTLSHFD